jgi:D-alanyl-D-alanine dipeptidase
MKYFPGNFLMVICLAVLLSLAGPAMTAGAVTAEGLGLDMADLAALDPTIIHDIKYATTDNFTGKILYPSARCLLREPVAYRLLQAQRLLRSQGLGLKVFDCYRSVEVQKKMWAVVPDSNYVANPAVGGSRHNRGASVDVGLVDAVGRELLMPSAFDEFSERSHLDYWSASAESLKNRQILQAVMKQAGFSPVMTEWWHFDAPDWRNYSLSNVDPQLIPSGAAQVLAVAEPLPGSAESSLWGFEKIPAGWRQVWGPIPVSLGRAGIAAMGRKREGDGMTPRGVFGLGLVFGYAETIDSRMPYRQATVEDVWVDDPSSPRYNQWLKGVPTAESHEKMRRNDHLYRLGVVINYNTDPIVAGFGSAIFLHIWKAPGQSTAGCVAMAEPELQKIVAWLDPAKSPQIILGYPGEQ